MSIIAFISAMTPIIAPEIIANLPNGLAQNAIAAFLIATPKFLNENVKPVFAPVNPVAAKAPSISSAATSFLIIFA